MGQRKKGKSKQVKAPVYGATTKGKFTIHIYLTPAHHTFHVHKVHNEMKITELKCLCELVVGLPSDIQRLSYLDDADLVDDSDIKSNDIVPGSTLTMSVWSMWNDLVSAVAHNDVSIVFNLGVTHDTDYMTPNMEYMSNFARRNYLSKRAETAFLLASRYGHVDIIQRLIGTGVNINAMTPNGRSALHIAAAQGHGGIVDVLMTNGANVDLEDNDGKTPLQIAEQFNHKSCGRHLFLFRWQQRAKKVKAQSVNVPLLDHQFFDSARSIHFKGEQLQIYRSQLAPPGEYDSTAFNARKHDPFSNSVHTRRMRERQLLAESVLSSDNLGTGAAGSSMLPPLNYDAWVQNKKKTERRKIRQLQADFDRKALIEEDKKLTELQKAESYDNWLKKQQQALTFESKSPGISPTPSQQIKTKGYLREYLDSLMEHKRNSVTSSSWLVHKGIDMLNSAEERPSLRPAWATVDTKFMEKEDMSPAVSQTQEVS